MVTSVWWRRLGSLGAGVALLAACSGPISFQVDVVMLDLFWDAEPTMISHRLVNVSARHVRSSNTWNASEWDAR